MRGQDIRELRSRYKPVVNPVEVAKAVGIHPNTLSDIERGWFEAPDDLLGRLAVAVTDVAQKQGTNLRKGVTV